MKKFSRRVLRIIAFLVVPLIASGRGENLQQSSQTVAAPASRPLTLEQAIAFVLASNPELQSATHPSASLAWFSQHR